MLHTQRATVAAIIIVLLIIMLFWGLDQSMVIEAEP
jgi:hypothetical protein